jgi:ubiquinone/menaquinone biosynthesis C-methylase UbiE
MNDSYLATGFGDVDNRSDATAFTGCLTLLDSLPYYREIKQRSYKLLALAPGVTVLEIGCGLGSDVLRMAELVAPGGSVTGVDVSARMVAAATARVRKGQPASFRQADARNLPFDDGSFMRCRVDRTLQHIERPWEVIAEMARVLMPEGLLVAYDNDWGSFGVSGSDHAATEAIEHYWIHSFVNPWIGRHLPRYFRQAGLTDITVSPSVSVIDSFELADQVYNLRQTAERLVEARELSARAAADWCNDLEQQSRAGCFLCSLTAYTVAGRKVIPPEG